MPPVPRYEPRLTPEQIKLIQRVQEAQRGGRPAALTYEQWMMATGRARPGQTKAQSGAGKKSSQSDQLKKQALNLGKKQAEDYVTKKGAESLGIDPGKAAQGLAGAGQLYNAYNQYKQGDKFGAGVSGVTGATNLAAAAGSETAGSVVPYLNAATGAASIGKQIQNTEGNSQDRAAASQAEALKTAALFVPVYGQAAYAALAGIDAVSGGKGTQQLVKSMNRANKLTDKVDFGIGKSIRNKLFHQSTRGVQKEHSGQLLGLSDDPVYQAYIQGMRAQHNEGPPDPTKPFAGKYGSWDEYKRGGLEASDLTGVYGNLKAFGPEWANMSFDQRKAVTQRLIDADLYNSKKGEVLLTDEDRAKQIFEEWKKNPVNPVGAVPPSVTGRPASAPPVIMIPRSQTSSPGIRKDGTRITYGH